FLTNWDHRDTRTVDQIMGAFPMIRRALFEKLGGVDERFFLYYEDVDLCLAARQAGWSVVHFAGARAKHAGGGSTEAVKDRHLFYLLTRRIENTGKRHWRLTAAVLMALILLFEIPIRCFYATLRSPRDVSLVVRAMTLFWQNLSKLSLRIVAGE